MAFTPNRENPVIVQNRDALEAIAGMVKATGSIIFAANATDTKVVSLYGTTFEFLDDILDVSEGNIAVHIGTDAEKTRDNLIDSINAVGNIAQVQSDTQTVVAVESSTDAIVLEYYDVGTAGNVSITTGDTNIAVVGMSGGTDGGVVNVNVSGVEFTGDIEVDVDDVVESLGVTTATPLAYNGDDEGSTARSGISLWKRMCNALKAIAATLVTLNGKVTACNTGAVVVSSSALPSGAATAEAQASLLAAVETQKPYSNVLAGYLTLSGSAEKLIPDYAAGTTYAAARFVNSGGKIYYSKRETLGDTPTTSTDDWQEVTPRAVTLWVNDGGSDVKRGNVYRQESTLFAGGMKEKLSVDTDGLLAMYVIGTAAGTLELEVME